MSDYVKRKQVKLKRMSIVLLLIFISDIIFPTVAWALTSGPAQPEFSSFEPVATTNMVNEFNGDFTYNLPVLEIPGPEGAGYSMSLSYHSGTSVEEEASWVGYGWTLNPGAINRSKRGIADDWNGREINYYNKTRSSKTATLGGSVGDLEFASTDLPVNANISLRYSNYKGFGYSAGAGLSAADGLFTIGFQYTDGESSFSAQINPGALLNSNKEGTKESKKQKVYEKKLDVAKSNTKMSDKKAAVQKLNDEMPDQAKAANISGALENLGSSGYSALSLFHSASPSASTPYTGTSFRMNISAQIDLLPPEAGFAATVFGSYSTQKNLESQEQSAFGTMYLANADDQDDVMDYDIERPGGYSRQDMVLPVNYSSADGYGLTGEGLSGGFRMFNKKIGHFRPSHAYSTTVLLSGGLQLDLGGESGGGGIGMLGLQELTVSDWDTNDDRDFSTSDEAFFRFTNDKGGFVRYNNSNTPEQAMPSGDNYNNSPAATLTEDPRSSSFIGFNYNRDFSLLAEGSGNKIKAYTKQDFPSEFNLDRDDPAIQDQIGEFSIVNETGSRYNYGLPVYTKKEEAINVGLRNPEDISSIDGDLVYMNNLPSSLNFSDGNLDVVVGQTSYDPYASAYLLTSITTSDYIDRTNNGPTPDDFGGYTLFNYEKVHSDFHWRLPYKGLTYNRNSFSDPKDDLAGYNSGEKDVYYLKNIETKTHIAEFITSDRTDGLEAEARALAADDGAISPNTLGKLKKLDYIKLSKKDSAGMPGDEIKRVNFKYTNDLQKNIPNSSVAGSGKLTLEKVWMEYNGIGKAKTAPYVFKYEYPSVNKYNGLGENNEYQIFGSHVASGLLSDANQNPDYNKYRVDAWGNYQPDATRKSMHYRTWMDQNLIPNKDFDPAVWQLKQIILPSGGEIQVQYEQDDYTYVQDQVAHGLFNLSDAEESINGGVMGEYKISAQTLGLSQSDLPDFIDQIEDIYVGTDQKMYFKFLYKLQGNGTPSLEDCASDYITGYFNVGSVINDPDDVGIIIEPVGVKPNIPLKVCRDFVRTSRVGMLTQGNCDPGVSGEVFDEGTSDAIEVIQNLKSLFQNFVPGNSCKRIDMEHSYLKLPIFRGIRSNTTVAAQESRIKGKIGGGLRVKRLLMFDDGMSTGQGKSLYGSEYFYVTKDSHDRYISSGVATNEPGGAREENPLVSFMKRFNQTLLNRVIAGKDRKQMEGPLGENILPSPSVGYSNVIVKGIHNGKTHQGYSVKQFHTVKEHPFVSSIDDSNNLTEIEHDNNFLTVPAIFVNVSDRIVRATQGFAFEMNNMHGQPKASLSYSNKFKYDNISASGLLNTLLENEDNNVLIAAEVTNYFAPGESISVISNPMGSPQLVELGVEQDMSFESKHIKDATTSLNIEADGGISIFGVVIFPWISASPTFTSVNNEIYTHVTSKVINYPAVVKNVSSYADGIWHISINEYFDYNTGKPIVTRSYDDFVGNADFGGEAFSPEGFAHNGSYTTYNFPAAHVYKNKGQKADHEGKTFPISVSSINIIDPLTDGGVPVHQLSLSGGASSICNGAMTAGDLIQLNTGVSTTPNEQKDIYHVDSFEGNNVNLLPVSYSTYTGNNPSSFEVIRSGRSNQLDENVGTMTVYGAPSSTYEGPTPGELAQMTSLTSLMSNNLSPQATTDPLNTVGSISSTQIQSAIGAPPLDLFLDGQCQTFPDNCIVQIEEGNLNIYHGHFEPLPDNVSCDDVSPYVAEQLNTYWYSMFNQSVNDVDVDQQLCQYEYPWLSEAVFFGPLGYLNRPKDDVPEDASIQQLANDLLNSPVDQGVAGVTHCGATLDSWFSTFRPRALRRTKRSNSAAFNGSAGNGINRTIVLKDDQFQNKYFVATLACPSEQDLEGFDILYGVIDDPSFDPVMSDIESTFGNVLQRIPFDPNADIGQFVSNDDNCLAFEYYATENGIQNDLLVEPLAGVDFNPADYDCSGNELIYDLVCSADLTGNGEYEVTSNGDFGINTEDGNYNLVYYPLGASSCPTVYLNVSCLSFCEITSNVIEDVVSASFNTLDDVWPYDHEKYYDQGSMSIFNNQNVYETGERGKWRLKSNYVYDVERGLVSDYELIPSEEKNYNTGVFDMLLFDWDSPPLYDAWKEINTVVEYSPNGNVLEERNILDIHSAAKFGYHKTLPYLVAQNSDYSSVFFESFENLYNEEYLEDGYPYDDSRGTQTSEYAHTGNFSMKLHPDNQGLFLTDVLEDSQLQLHGGIAKVWVRTNRVDRENISNDLSLIIEADDEPVGPPNYFQFVARSGDWALYESRTKVNLPIDSKIYLKYDFIYAQEDFFIDDIRLQPKESQVNTYVYDPNNFRLIASFDDQNFALLYQYNTEGQLVRKAKETTRGVKTIQETQYNTYEHDDDL